MAKISSSQLYFGTLFFFTCSFCKFCYIYFSYFVFMIAVRPFSQSAVWRWLVWKENILSHWKLDVLVFNFNGYNHHNYHHHHHHHHHNHQGIRHTAFQSLGPIWFCGKENINLQSDTHTHIKWFFFQISQLF